MNRQELIDAYSDWLAGFKWCWFGTLTFRRSDIPFSIADHTFKDWIREIETGDGADDFRWFRVTERGAYGCNLHFHILIGGLRNGTKLPWILRWNEMAGDALITYYFRSGNATRYIVKTAHPDRDFEIDFNLSSTTSKKGPMTWTNS